MGEEMSDTTRPMTESKQLTARRGVFITFEGVEGCGKTTQTRLLTDRLAAAGIRTLLTREPGGAAISEQIRALVLDMRNEGMEPLAEALLYEAARAQFVAQIVRPALLAETVVICDRYTDSTLAYQGYGRGLHPETLETLNTIATAGIAPDATVFVDVPVSVGLARRVRGGEWNRFDAAGQAFHQRVYDGYHALAARNDAGRWHVVDGTADEEAVAAAVWEALASLLAKNNQVIHAIWGEA